MAVAEMQELEKIVLTALENASYDWRTIAGIANETNLPETTVSAVLAKIPSGILAVTSGKHGQKLYTTRKHYKKNRPFFSLGRILTAFSDELK